MKTKRIRRNEPCPCGSGKKAKKCHLRQISEFRHRVDQGESPQSLMVERILGEPSEPAQPDPSPES
jgi:hypothetical protein